MSSSGVSHTPEGHVTSYYNFCGVKTLLNSYLASLLCKCAVNIFLAPTGERKREEEFLAKLEQEEIVSKKEQELG